MPLLLALDQGTTSSRAILFAPDGRIVASAQQEHRQIFPRPGWVEHDAMEIWQAQLAVGRKAIAAAGVGAAEIAAIGIANQRETTVLWDRATGRPVHNAIVWQDRRTAGECDRLKSAGHLPVIQQTTGLVLDAYFSAPKLRWLLDNVAEARAQAEEGKLAFGTIDTWLLWNLTGGKVHATDPSNAARTLLFDIHRARWDPALLNLFDIPENALPRVAPTSGIFGHTPADLFGAPIPIAALAGDQQAALFGHGCFSRGMAKNTYGTGCFMLMNLQRQAAISRHKLLTTIAWQAGGSIDYALEGSVFVGGAVVQWLRDGLGLLNSSAEIESLAGSVADSAGVYLVPAFAGLGAPHWDQYARGGISGLTRGVSKAHIARAALESIAFQVADVLDVMRQDTGIDLSELRADGGAAANDLLMQFQADLLGVTVIRPVVTETTALGAAALAGLAVGIYRDPTEFASQLRIARGFEPRMSRDEVAHRRARWTEALRRCLDWEER